MADLSRRPSSTPRAVRERRAYRLAVGGVVVGLAGLVGIVLAVAGVIGAGLPILALVLAAACALLFRRTVAA